MRFKDQVTVLHMSTDGTFLRNAVEADTAWVGCAWTTCGRSLFNNVQQVYIKVEIHLESCWEEIVEKRLSTFFIILLWR